ncbi:acyl--CoA ligase [Dehalobacter sp. DCM]|uniref:class I adenylate-forming enzyme family protein n=1 Tax=Dehalobacter sp. DCM TaxID=2907827 RepID=UPI003081EB61|nr:acyl--CoA ligase [Dehalobacter sp. DCM]
MLMKQRKNRLEDALPKFSDYLRKWAKERPEHTAFIYRDSAITYHEFMKKSETMAKYLLKIGVGHGDRLAYIMTGRPEFFVFYMAASMVGAIVVGLSTRNPVQEMLYILENAQPSHILCLDSLGEDRYQERLAKVFAQYPFYGQIWLVEGCRELPQAHSFEDIMSQNYDDFADALAEREKQVGSDDGLIIVYTSGSTGRSKGALLTHRNVISSALVQLQEFGAPTGCTPADIFQHQVPVNHVSGAIEWGATPIIGGCTQVLTDGFKAKEVLENTEKYKATILAGVPTMWTMMFNLPDFMEYDLSSVRFCLVSGAMVSKKIVQGMKEISPYCCNGLGMTETSGFMTYSDVGASAENICQTVGKCAPEFEMKIVDKDGQPLADGLPGEILYRGPTVMKEYYHEPELTAAAIDKDGWLYSGDIGFIDQNGDLRLLGRTKDMYICGGYNVYPAEVEEQIARYPGVSLVAVLPVSHEIMGEVGCAYIVPKPGYSLDGKGIREYLKDLLADYKIPRKYEFRECLPLTPLGKIDKKNIIR